MNNEQQSLNLIEFRSGNSSVIPGPGTTPDLDAYDVDVVASDQFWVLLREDAAVAQEIVRDYPYWRWFGCPADGRWIDGESGEEYYILNGETVDLPTLAQDKGFTLAGLGLDPDTDTWEDVDEDLVLAYIPTF